MNKTQITVLIITLICFLIWLGADLRRTKPSEVVSPELQKALEPFSPGFDQDTLDKIENLEQKSIDSQAITPPPPQRATTSSATPSPVRSPDSI